MPGFKPPPDAMEDEDKNFTNYLFFLIALLLFCCACCFRRTRQPRRVQNNQSDTDTAVGKSEKERRAEIESALILRRVLEHDDDISSTGSSKSLLSSATDLIVSLRRASLRPVRFSDPYQKTSSFNSTDTDQTEKDSAYLEEGFDNDNTKSKSNSNGLCCAPATDDGLYNGLQPQEQDYAHPTTCDICLLEYEAGDEVAWSPNEECVHAFHRECIVDWLIRNPKCPLCRGDYLATAEKETETA